MNLYSKQKYCLIRPLICCEEMDKTLLLMWGFQLMTMSPLFVHSVHCILKFPLLMSLQLPISFWIPIHLSSCLRYYPDPLCIYKWTFYSVFFYWLNKWQTSVKSQYFPCLWLFIIKPSVLCIAVKVLSHKVCGLNYLQKTTLCRGRVS